MADQFEQSVNCRFCSKQFIIDAAHILDGRYTFGCPACGGAHIFPTPKPEKIEEIKG